jgi:hypothetical protein
MAKAMSKEENHEVAVRKRKQRILDLVPKLVEWARKKETWKVTQVDVKEFLLTNEFYLPRNDVPILTRWANSALDKMQDDLAKRPIHVVFDLTPPKNVQKEPPNSS